MKWEQLFNKSFGWLNESPLQMVISEKKLVKSIHRYKILQKQPPESSVKKGVLRILQNSQEYTCARDSF